jgi:hypothetical protein
MNSEKIEKGSLFSKEIIDKINSKKMHLVCPAKFKDSYCMEYLVGHLGMSIYDVETFCAAVNGKKEPGCLYPKYTVTLFPTEESNANILTSVLDTIKAQEQYFKTSEMLLAFDESSSNYYNEVRLEFDTEFKKLGDEINLKILYYVD